MRKPAACFLFAVLSLSLVSTAARADEAPVALGPPAVPHQQPQEEEERVRVHVTTDKDVKERADVFAVSKGVSFQHLCTAPCEVVVPPATRLAVRMNKSDDEGVGTVRRAYGSDVDLAIGPPSRTSKKVGAILAITGAMLLVGGIGTYFAFASYDDKPRNTDASVGLSGKGFGLMLGVPLGIAGLSLVGAGAAFLASSSDAPDVRISPHREKTSASR